MAHKVKVCITKNNHFFVRFVSLKEGEEPESLEWSPDQQQQQDNGAMEGLRLQLALARLDLEEQDNGAMEGLRLQLALARLEQQQQDDNGAMEGLRLQLALARMELEHSQSAREQAASDLSLTR